MKKEEGERQLLRAMVLRSWAEALTGDQEARAWFLYRGPKKKCSPRPCRRGEYLCGAWSPGDPCCLFTFEEAADYLGLDPDAFRKALGHLSSPEGRKGGRS